MAEANDTTFAKGLRRMPTNSLSAEIRYANSRMAEALREQEEREQLLQAGRYRDPDRNKEERRGRLKNGSSRSAPAASRRRDIPKINRWDAPVAYSQPSPLVDRPRSENGATSFHFSVKPVSKEGVPTAGGKPLSGYAESDNAPGAEHARYTERDEAVEHAAYVERDAAIERDPSLQDIPSDLSNAIGEGLDDLDLVRDARGIPSIFSNISDDPNEREEYWRAIHRSERNPRVHSLLIDASADRAWAEAAARDPGLPESVRTELAFALADLDREAEAIDRKPQPRVWTGTSEACGAVLERARRIPPYYRNTPVLTFQSGRGGRVQYRFVAELPHELTAPERAALVREFCDVLGSLETGPGEEVRGMMYTAAIHAPDRHNDPRNFHVHIVAHDRPAIFMPLLGKWDFECEEIFERKGEIRVRYPFRQTKLRRINSRRFIPQMRETFADITNRALARAGIERRYDPRTYEEMGIDRTPTEHLGTKAAALEAVGVATDIGNLNAQRIWADAERQVARTAAQRLKQDRERRERIKALAGTARAQLGHAHPEVMRFIRLASEHERISTDTIEDRQLLDGFELAERKARSRAAKVRQTCLSTLAAIERGEAKAAEIKVRPKISARLREANAWLSRLDAALAPQRAGLEASGIDVLKREDRLAELNNEIEKLASRLTDLVDKAARARRAPHTPTDPRQAAERDPGNRPASDNKASSLASQKKDSQPDAGRIAKPTSPFPAPEKRPDPKPVDRDPATAKNPTQPPAPRPLDNARPVAKDVAGPAKPEPSATPRKDPDRPTQAPATPSQDADILRINERWNALINTVNSKGMIVPAPDGTPGRLTIANISEDEQKLIDHPRFAKRSQARLQALLVFQEREITRLAAWIKKHLDDDKALAFNPTGVDVSGAPLAIRSLFERYGRHPDILPQLIAGSDRMQEVTAVLDWMTSNGRDPQKLPINGQTISIKAMPPDIGEKFRRVIAHPRITAALAEEKQRREALQAAPPEVSAPANLAGKSGPPSPYRPIPLAKIRSPILRDLVSALNNGDSPDDLYPEALAVQRNRAASLEIHEHGEGLSVAFTMALEPAQAPPQRRQRDGWRRSV